MRCPSCAIDAPADAKFCPDCGARLPLACPACAQPIEPRHRFCPGCGQRLDATAPPTPTPSAPTAAAGERRQVTVLFVDLAGYTELSSRLDAEEVHRLLGGFFERADGLVEAHGGSVDKHIGDCVMAVFGAPVAHGNDPERAARTALGIQAGMPALGARLGQPLAVHIGIASGQVVASDTGSASRQEYTVTGDSVNLAARLTDQAKAGETLLSDQVRRLLPEGFQLAGRGALVVQGIAEPVETWQLLGVEEKPDVSRRPFVGRRAELRQLEVALKVCAETGTGQAIHVRGEAGIGKTRLVEEFRGRARELGFADHTGLVLDFGTVTGQDAVRALVRSLLGLRLGGDVDRARAAAEAAGGGSRTCRAADRLTGPRSRPPIRPPDQGMSRACAS